MSVENGRESFVYEVNKSEPSSVQSPEWYRIWRRAVHKKLIL